MAMRIYVAFPRPLTRADRLRTSVSLGALAGCTRVRWLRGDREAEVLGEGLAVAKVKAALDESETPWERVETSLTPEEDHRLDEIGDGQERVKPPGR
jgi:hypothetical protein